MSTEGMQEALFHDPIGARLRAARVQAGLSVEQAGQQLRLPLAIIDVKTDRGGASKFVTTTITGAQFSDQATVKLIRPGIAEFAPVDWRVVDSRTIIATFDLTDAPHGLYDVIVTNPSGAAATSPYRFLIERSIQGDVTIGIGGSPSWSRRARVRKRMHHSVPADASERSS